MQQSVLSYRAGAHRCCGRESRGIVFGNWGRSLVKTQPGAPEERITFPAPQHVGWVCCLLGWVRAQSASPMSKADWEQLLSQFLVIRFEPALMEGTCQSGSCEI